MKDLVERYYGISSGLGFNKSPLAHTPSIEIYQTDGEIIKIDGDCLDAENSQHVFHRDGTIHHLVVFVNEPSP